MALRVVRSVSACLFACTGVFAPLFGIDPGPFFEPEQPFFQSQVEVAAPSEPGVGDANFVVRGIVVPLAVGPVIIFDQELLRVAAVVERPPGEPPITPRTMAQISYVVAQRKATGEHPQPSGPVHLSTSMLPGVAATAEALDQDPRPASRPGDVGRGALPLEVGRFEGVELAAAGPILHYRSGGVRFREWYEGAGQTAEGFAFRRHLAVEAQRGPVWVRLGRTNGAWRLTAQRAEAQEGRGPSVCVTSTSPGVEFIVRKGELVAALAPSAAPRRLTFEVVVGNVAPRPAAEPELAAAPAPAPRRWPGQVAAPVETEVLSQNGLVLDRAAVPEENPWRRRVRVADLAFRSADRAAAVTYDGDVWLVEGFAADPLEQLRWQRFASGLHEPLAIAVVDDAIQVATKNGLVRLFDRDGNGEADWFANFNDQIVQSQTTRSFPLDMAIAPDGATLVTQGGIISAHGMAAGGSGTRHSGAVLRIAPDGRSIETVATGAREPFVTVHPKTGVITGTDQQGHFIPSSVCYLIRPGDSFGFPEPEPQRLTPPLVWLPHDQDSSSSSQVWMVGAGMGAWRDRLLHLSYGTGRLFLIAPDFAAPVPQAAAIPLGIDTDLPLLHARMHPSGEAVWLAGFQIYGSRTSTAWGLGRLRPGPTPITTPLSARAVAEGVLLEFATPLDPASLRAEHVNARVWNYRRSAEYGSGRYDLDGEPGAPAWPVGQVVASRDGRTVFLHLPDLPPVMQLEIRTRFRLASGEEAGGLTYFTIHALPERDLAAAGFDPVDLSRSVPVIAPRFEPDPSAELGATLAQSLGCVACHSTDGSGGRIGPTWKGLFGSRRIFADGSVDWADESYVREKILDPRKRPLTGNQVEMPSYRGVISDAQLDSLVLYLKTLR